MTRPLCVHCGKAYGQRAVETETVRWEGEAADAPPYRGNRIFVKDRFVHARGSALIVGMDRNEVRPLPQWSATRETWDGETWIGGYKPFCTLRCALSYARKAFRILGSGL